MDPASPIFENIDDQIVYNISRDKPIQSNHVSSTTTASSYPPYSLWPQLRAISERYGMYFYLIYLHFILTNWLLSIPTDIPSDQLRVRKLRKGGYGVRNPFFEGVSAEDIDPNDPLKCTECGRQYENHRALVKHREGHLKQKRYLCIIFEPSNDE